MENKKGMSLLLASSILASGAPAVFAEGVQEDVSDVTLKLNALNIVFGRGADEGFAENETITRAEFAALGLRILGAEDGAEFTKNMTVFSDVPKGEWYTGIVNLAYTMGIVKGYGDGRFGPNDPVTRAEALTMLVRILGYEKVVNKEVAWPANYLVQANELKLAESVSNMADFNSPAYRNEVFQMIDNSLETPRLIKDANDEYVVSEKTLMEEKLDLQYNDVVLLDAGTMLDSSLKDNEVLVETKDGDTLLLKLEAGLDIDNPYEALMNDEIGIVYDKDGIVSYVKQKANSFIEDKVYAVNNIDKSITFKDSDNMDVEIYVDDFTPVLVDYVNVGYAKDIDFNTYIKAGAKVSYEIKNDEIVKLVVKNYNNASVDYVLVESVDLENGIIKNYAGSDIDIKDKKVKVMLNNEVVSYDEIKNNDVVYVFKDSGNEELVLEIIRDKAVFRIDRIDSSATPEYVYINGEKVKINTSVARYSKDFGKTAGTFFDTSLVGEYVVAYKDAYGEVVSMFGDLTSASPVDFYMVKKKVGSVMMDNGEVKEVVELLNSNGDSAAYALHDSISINSITEQYFVAVELKDGEIISINEVTSLTNNGSYKYDDNGGAAVSIETAIDADTENIKIGSTYYIIDKADFTVFFINDDGQVAAGNWEDVKGATGKANLKLLYEENGGVARILYVENAGASSADTATFVSNVPGVDNVVIDANAAEGTLTFATVGTGVASVVDKSPITSVAGIDDVVVTDGTTEAGQYDLSVSGDILTITHVDTGTSEAVDMVNDLGGYPYTGTIDFATLGVTLNANNIGDISPLDGLSFDVSVDETVRASLNGVTQDKVMTFNPSLTDAAFNYDQLGVTLELNSFTDLAALVSETLDITSDRLDVASEKITAIVIDRNYRKIGEESGIYYQLSNGQGFFIDNNAIVTAEEFEGYGANSIDRNDIGAGDIVSYQLNEKKEIKVINEIDMSNARIVGGKVDQITKDFYENRVTIVNDAEDTFEYYWFHSNVVISDARDKDNIVKLNSYTEIPKDVRVVFNLDSDGKTITEIIIVGDK